MHTYIPYLFRLERLQKLGNLLLNRRLLLILDFFLQSLRERRVRCNIHGYHMFLTAKEDQNVQAPSSRANADAENARDCKDDGLTGLETAPNRGCC